MVQYIYFVKCPHCDDEPFDFFNDAKSYAMGCISKKPVIVQVEVNRNDFGECTDSNDLGTVWSWEDLMNDIPNDAPELSTFSKSATLADPEDHDEFATLDNSLDSVPDNFCRPIPEGMTLRELVETMEENEDRVECVYCQELFAKEDGTCDDKHGWLCPDCEDATVECTWCEELYDRSLCRYELNLGWLCSRCEAAIKSRGETLTFIESCESIDRKQPIMEDASSMPSTVELEYDNLTVFVYGRTIPGGYMDPPEREESEVTISYTYDADVNSVIEFLQDEITEEEICELAGLSSANEIPWWEPDRPQSDYDAFWDLFWEQHLEYLVAKYNDKLLDYFRESAEEAAQEYANDHYTLDDFWESCSNDTTASATKKLTKGELREMIVELLHEELQNSSLK